MNWYLSKIIYQIICGEGKHTPQFDEQLRLISACDEEEAFEKAYRIGLQEEDTFSNDRQELVQWKFINVAELHHLTELVNGAEVYSRITEADDAGSFINAVHKKSDAIKKNWQYEPVKI